MRLKEILFPTDLSPAAMAAGRLARDIAAQAGAHLHVINVVSPANDSPQLVEELTRVAKSLSETLGLQTAIVRGQTGKTIVEYACDHRIDLIVMGTHGRTGFSRALLGSVAEMVVRLAPCPVLTVPARITTDEERAEPALPEPSPCLACRKLSDELICPDCRERIRAEALVRDEEHPDHRGLPV